MLAIDVPAERPSLIDLRARIAAKRRDGRAVVRSFAQAIACDDISVVAKLLGTLDADGLWCPALRAIARQPGAPSAMRRKWLAIWLDHGDHVRQEVANDLLLSDALRCLLPAYRGGDQTLYRGDSARNRRRGTYGLSWSKRRSVADGFAVGWSCHHPGGSVLLRAVVPAAAIICAVPRRRDAYGEAEILVDRRRLGAVEVLRRYPYEPQQAAG